MTLRVTNIEVIGPPRLRLTFNDGTTKTVDTLPLLEGPVLEPLRDPDYFVRVRLDPARGTAVWPNGADLAPEALYELADQPEPVSG